MTPLLRTTLLWRFVFLFIVTVQGQVHASMQQQPMCRETHYLKHHNQSLNVTPIVSINVLNNLWCTDLCSREQGCFSFNLAIAPINDMFECQLLPTDKYNSSSKFENNKNFIHYSMEVSRMLLTADVAASISFQHEENLGIVSLSDKMVFIYKLCT